MSRRRYRPPAYYANISSVHALRLIASFRVLVVVFIFSIALNVSTAVIQVIVDPRSAVLMLPTSGALMPLQYLQ